MGDSHAIPVCADRDANSPRLAILA
jgi:hypothetical protein